VREKRKDHDGNLEVCLERPRPIRVRKVGTSGTKGVGSGIILGGCLGVFGKSRLRGFSY